jgi:hypothetical protein
MAKHPNIGIWWDNGRQIIAFTVLSGSPDPVTGLCDSDDSHNDCWPEAAMQLGASPDDEYFSIPRGRVLYDPKNRTSIIYHGNRTDETRLALVATKFDLKKWEAKKDGHYMMGSAADLFFDED